MSDKAALRAAAIWELGARFDDALEGARGRTAEARGQVGAFAAGARAVAALEGHVDAEVESGELDLEAATLAKRWLGRARGALESLGRQAENRVLMTEGEARAWAGTVELTKKAHELELAKAPAVRPVEAEEDRARRPSIKARRQAEEAQAAEKPKRKTTRKKATRKPRKAG